VPGTCSVESCIAIYPPFSSPPFASIMQDYRIYFPMTANLNKQLMARAGDALSSRMYDSAPTDCTYNGTNARGQRTVVSKDCGSCVSTAFSRNAEDWDLAKGGIV
jgi:hypothetical protein